MKKYKARKELLPYIEGVLSRRRRSYRSDYDPENDAWYIITDSSSASFHETVLRAICEKETDEKGGSVIYVTQEEHDDPIRLMTLLQELGHNDDVNIAISKPQ